MSQVRFNRVPDKVPVKVWEALVQSQLRCNRALEKVLEKVWEALVQSQIRFTDFRRRFRRRSGRLWSGEGLGSFGAEPGQVQQD